MSVTLKSLYLTQLFSSSTTVSSVKDIWEKEQTRYNNHKAPSFLLYRFWEAPLIVAEYS